MFIILTDGTDEPPQHKTDQPLPMETDELQLPKKTDTAEKGQPLAAKGESSRGSSLFANLPHGSLSDNGESADLTLQRFLQEEEEGLAESADLTLQRFFREEGLAESANNLQLSAAASSLSFVRQWGQSASDSSSQPELKQALDPWDTKFRDFILEMRIPGSPSLPIVDAR